MAPGDLVRHALFGTDGADEPMVDAGADAAEDAAQPGAEDADGETEEAAEE
jgi:hypothetical protein